MKKLTSLLIFVCLTCFISIQKVQSNDNLVLLIKIPVEMDQRHDLFH